MGPRPASAPTTRQVDATCGPRSRGRTVDVHIARLRRKLGPEFRDAIRTVRRVGYMYVPPTRS